MAYTRVPATFAYKLYGKTQSLTDCLAYERLPRTLQGQQSTSAGGWEASRWLGQQWGCGRGSRAGRLQACWQSGWFESVNVLAGRVVVHSELEFMKYLNLNWFSALENARETCFQIAYVRHNWRWGLLTEAGRTLECWPGILSFDLNFPRCELQRVLHIGGELFESTTETASRWSRRLKSDLLLQCWLRLRFSWSRWNKRLLSEDHSTCVETAPSLGSLWERLLLLKFLGRVHFLSHNFSRPFIVVGNSRRQLVKEGHFADFAFLWWVSVEISRLCDNVAVLILDDLLYINSVDHMFVGCFVGHVSDDLRGFECNIMTSFFMTFRVSLPHHCSKRGLVWLSRRYVGGLREKGSIKFSSLRLNGDEAVWLKNDMALCIPLG